MSDDGRARMAAARRVAGQLLDEDDLEALRQYPNPRSPLAPAANPRSGWIRSPSRSEVRSRVCPNCELLSIFNDEDDLCTMCHRDAPQRARSTAP
jgi:hypothetical protein